MCQNPSRSTSPQPDPNSSPNPNPSMEEDDDEEQEEEGEGNESSSAAAAAAGEERSRDLKRRAQVDDLARRLSSGGDPAAMVQAAREVRRLARESSKTRSALAVSAVVEPLVAMLSSPDGESSKEAALLAVLNLAVRNESNKEKIVKCGAVPHLIELLKYEGNGLSELATAAVLTLSASTPNKPTLISAGAVPLLVQILSSGKMQGKVDAVTALYNLSSCKDSSGFNLPSEAVKPLLSLLKDCKRYSKFAEKATGLLEILSKAEEGRSSISEFDGGILTLVETVEEGSLLSKEYAVGVLFSLCDSCRDKYRNLILSEGPIPGLMLLTVEGTKKARDRARKLLDLLRDSRPERVTSNNLEVLVYEIATRLDGPAKAAATAKRLLEDLERRNSELSSTKLQHERLNSSDPSATNLR